MIIRLRCVEKGWSPHFLYENNVFWSQKFCRNSRILEAAGENQILLCFLRKSFIGQLLSFLLHPLYLQTFPRKVVLPKLCTGSLSHWYYHSLDSCTMVYFILSPIIPKRNLSPFYPSHLSELPNSVRMSAPGIHHIVLIAFVALCGTALCKANSISFSFLWGDSWRWFRQWQFHPERKSWRECNLRCREEGLSWKHSGLDE